PWRQRGAFWHFEIALPRRPWISPVAAPWPPSIAWASHRARLLGPIAPMAALGTNRPWCSICPMGPEGLNRPPTAQMVAGARRNSLGAFFVARATWVADNSQSLRVTLRARTESFHP